MLPAPLVARLAGARKVVELAAGRDFRTALAIQEAAPRATVLVTDADSCVLEAPAPLVACTLDILRPDPTPLAGADLLVAVRIPEELQRPAALLARALRVDLALRPLKDEWADVSDVLPRALAWPDGWRLLEASSKRRERL